MNSCKFRLPWLAPRILRVALILLIPLPCGAEQNTNPCVSKWGDWSITKQPEIPEAGLVINSASKLTLDGVDTLVCCLKEDPAGSGTLKGTITADITYTTNPGEKRRVDSNGCKPPEDAPFPAVLDVASWSLSGPSTATPTSGTGQSATFSATDSGEGVLTFTLKFKGGNPPPEWTKTVTKTINVKFIKVTSVVWVQKEAPLDANPNAGGGKRLFPDAETPSGSARKKVSIEATIDPVVKGIDITFRVIDVDDPSSNTTTTDLDDESKTTDNRGSFNLLNANAATDTSGKAKVDMEVSMFAGDNFRAVAACCPCISGWTAKQSDGSSASIEDGPGNPVMPAQVSELLTVWRRLRVEVDSMGAVHNNFIDGNITGLTGTGTAATQLVSSVALNDGSADLDSTPSRNGRFDKGTVVLGGSVTINPITGNGSNRIVFPSHTVLPLSFQARDNDWFLFPSTMAGTITEITKSGGSFVLHLNVTSPSPASSADWPDFVGGTLAIAGGSDLSVISTDATSSTMIVTSLAIPFRLTDDDVAEGTDVPMPDTSYLVAAFEPAYVQVVTESGQGSLPFIANIDNSSPATRRQGWDFGGESHNKNEYWVVYVRGAFQPDRDEDRDADSEGVTFGIVDNIRGTGCNIYTEVMRHPGEFTSTYDLAKGRSEKHTVAHEIGHLFGGSHDPTNGYDLGLMSQTGSRTSPDFSEKTLAKIRITTKP